MIFTHEFTTPRNLYDKLIRENEQLDMVVSGDTILDFVCTAVCLHEWLKNAPQNETTAQFVNKVSRDPNIKICKDIFACKATFCVKIDDPALEEGSLFEHIRVPENYDLLAYTNQTKKFTLTIATKEVDIFKFKEEIALLYAIYFKV
ncbi:MAG: hypothetical protein V1773_16100 [bacterium]